MSAGQASPSPSTLSAASGAPAIGVELAHLPWARPFNLDVANAFDKVAHAFAGNPAQPAAWRDAIARVTAHPRDRAAIAAALAAQQAARQSPEPARANAARLADPRAVVDRHRPAGRHLRRPHLHAAQGADRHQAGARGRGDARRAGGAGVLGRRRGSRLERGRRAVRCSTPSWRRRRSASARRRGPGRVRSRPCRCRPAPPPPPSPPCARPSRPPSSPTRCIASLARHYGDGVTLARAFAGVMDDLLGPLGLVVYDASDPATKPLAGPLFVRELSSPGETSRLAAAAGAALDARGYKAQVTPGAGQRPRCSRSARRASRSGAREHGGFAIGDRQVSARRPGRRGDGPSRALQPQRAAAAARPGHALPDHRLRRRPERGRPTSPS